MRSIYFKITLLNTLLLFCTSCTNQILKDFEIEGLKKEQLTPYYEIFGKDRTLMILPLKWILTALPPSGSLTNLIMGGHVKLKPKKHITIFYYPEWI